MRDFLRWTGTAILGILLLGMVTIPIAGCKKSKIDSALDSDANGYMCQACQAKFYTDRDVFANICPSCKSPRIAQVVGFVCPEDHFVTVAPRGTGSMPCGKCGKMTWGLSIPREFDLKAAGAVKKSKSEVGV